MSRLPATPNWPVPLWIIGCVLYAPYAALEATVLAPVLCLLFLCKALLR